MLKAIIIDDEQHCCDVLAAMLASDNPQVSVLAICNSGLQGLSAIKEFKPDIVFLDVEMPKMNGFEMLDLAGKVDFQVIFTTSYDQYALKAIRFSALDYLLKPVDRQELAAAVQKAEEKLRIPLPAQLELLLQKIRQPGSINRIALPTMEGLQLIPVDNIVSCESEDNYTKFFLKGGKKVLATRSLKEIEQLLDPYSFVRVHRSFLVNANEIERYVKGEGGYLVMTDGSTIDVSQSRKESLLKKLKHE